MKFEKRAAVALIAGVALYQLLGPQIEHIRGLIDSLVLAELMVRAFKLDEFFKS